MPFLHLDLDFQATEIAGEAVGEIAGYEQFLDSPLPQNLPDHRREALGFQALLFEFFATVTPGENPAMTGLFACSIDLEIIQHDMAFAVDAEINEGVGDEHP